MSQQHHELDQMLSDFMERTTRNHLLEEGDAAMKNVSNELNISVNFRVNSGLRDEFEKVCKANHSNMSRELKRYMTAVVQTQRIF